MDIGATLPIWSIIPFAGMLLCIAILPLTKLAEWWEHHQLHVAIFWSLVFLIPFTIAYGMHETGYELMESVVLDYIPFIVLLLGLFTVGQHSRGGYHSRHHAQQRDYAGHWHVPGKLGGHHRRRHAFDSPCAARKRVAPQQDAHHCVLHLPCCQHGWLPDPLG